MSQANAETEQQRWEANRQEWAADQARAKDKGMSIHGFPRRCRCGGTAYHSGTASWQNRVVCLDCGRKWSE